MPADLGFTHIALVVADMEASLAFYADYANMHVVHRRNGQGRGDVVAWISDGTRPFVIVLIQQPGLKDRPLGPIGHLGVARSEEHTSELQSLMRISYAVFCLTKKNKHNIPSIV